VASIVNKNFNKVNLIGPMVASVLFNASNSKIKLNFGQVKDLAKVLSRISGGDVLSVIKNIENNNLPLYQLVSLAYRLQDVKSKIDDDIYSDDRDSIYTHNIVYNNTENF
jgi:hypothetical protein